MAVFSSFIIPPSAFEMSLVTRRCCAMAWQALAATGAELGQCHVVEGLPGMPIKNGIAGWSKPSAHCNCCFRPKPGHCNGSMRISG